MKIVIDIPKEQYNKIVSMYGTFPTEMKKWGLSAIKNGTPLPKGHGRLIDADYMIKQLLSLPKDEFSTDDMWAIKVLELAPTIIEGSDS